MISRTKIANGLSIGLFAALDSCSNGVKVSCFGSDAGYHNGLVIAGLNIIGKKINGSGIALWTVSADTMNGAFFAINGGVAKWSSRDTVNESRFQFAAEPGCDTDRGCARAAVGAVLVTKCVGASVVLYAAHAACGVLPAQSGRDVSALRSDTGTAYAAGVAAWLCAAQAELHDLHRQDRRADRWLRDHRRGKRSAPADYVRGAVFSARRGASSGGHGLSRALRRRDPRPALSRSVRRQERQKCAA